MALNQTIYPEIVKTENRDLQDFHFRFDDNKKEIIEQKVIHNPAKRNKDNKDVTFRDGKLSSDDDIKYSTENQDPHSTTEEIFPKSAITASQQLFTESQSDQRTNETDYYVIRDPDNATVFHIQFIPSDQDINKLRHWNSSIVYYGPELKPCSVLLMDTDYQTWHRQQDSLEQQISGKSKILLQEIYPGVASDLTNKSDDSSADITGDEDRILTSGNAEVKYTIGYSTTAAKDNSISDAMTINAFTNWSDYDECTSYDVIQDPNNPFLFHVRQKTVDSHMVSDQATIRRLHQSSIFYYGPELKSCFVPVKDFRVRCRKPNPLESMEFFAARPIRKRKRKSKKTK